MSQFLVPLPPIQLAHKILSMRCGCVGITSDGCVREAYRCLYSLHFALCYRQYRTRSPDRFPTRLPSKIHPEYPWSRAWISLHQHYHHVCRIFSTNGHCQYPVHPYAFRVDVLGKFHDGHHPSYLRRWLRTQRFLMHV